METSKSRLRFASILSLLVICAFFLAARLMYLYVADPKRFPINTIKIAASYQHITHKQLEVILDKHLDRSSFFSLPVRRLHTELSALEWTRQVQIDRVWPDVLNIRLEEKIPVAAWNNAWITQEGEIFDEGVEKKDSTLPQLKGPINQHEEVLQVYQKMSKILSECGLQAAILERRDNQAWELSLSNGVMIHLGKNFLEMRLLRFCKAYPAIFGDKPEQLLSVDLRYPRGMAVKWKNKRENNG